MNSTMHILTRTPLHVGAGASVGAIDMPVQRERHTQIPIIPGSSLKGVLRDLWDKGSADQIDLFGPDSDKDEHVAGNLLIGEARVVCFPVRSAKGAFAWITCPLALQRYARETGGKLDKFPPPSDDSCLAAEGVKIGDAVVLEEYSFKATNALPPSVIALLKDAFNDDPLWTTLEQRLVILSDGLFSHFCANACEVQQRIRIDDDTGTVAKGGLFNQENIPADTLFYAVMGERKDGNVAKLRGKIESMGNILQIGAHETTGLGFCSISMKGGAQ